jgi:hypothetical protein
MRNIYNDSDAYNTDADAVRESPRWWLRERSSYEKSDNPTSPKLISAHHTTTDGREPLWTGQVVEEGTTHNGDRWFFVQFSGFGVPYSSKRRESVEAAFITVETARGAAVFSEKGKARAHVQFLILRNNADKMEKVDVVGEWPIGAHRYGPYTADILQAHNKWEIVQLAIDKTLRKWLRTPLLEEFLELPDADLIYNLDWMSEIAFPDMDRGFKGV